MKPKKNVSVLNKKKLALNCTRRSCTFANENLFEGKMKDKDAIRWGEKRREDVPFKGAKRCKKKYWGTPLQTKLYAIRVALTRRRWSAWWQGLVHISAFQRSAQLSKERNILMKHSTIIAEKKKVNCCVVVWLCDLDLPCVASRAHI